MQLPKEVKKYLSKQNFGNWYLEIGKTKYFHNIVVIPALNEFENIPQLLNSISKNSTKYLKETLIIFVVNNSENEKTEVVENNFKSIEFIRQKITDNESNLNIGLINASTKGKAFSVKNGGVGSARKLGMDLALNYFNYSSNQKKLLISLDADCLVKEDYLEEITYKFNSENLHATVVSFEHILPENLDQKKAIINYEIFLRHYILGLKYAKSHYDYISVGSTIICNAESYVKVGGMNKKKGGEDFYFLEKLAKLGKISKITNTKVYPSSRISDRVPFGTGPRIKRFLENKQNEYETYSNEIFDILKKWLEIFNSELFFNDWEIKTKEIHPELFKFLISQNFNNDWLNILKNSKSKGQIIKQKLNWMDSFRTLKLVHHLRDSAFPNENMFTSLNLLLDKLEIQKNYDTTEEIPSLEIQLKYLELLRRLT
ncbi:MAG: hypothetical protein KDC88_07005 [Ignavibacteriae bacterium]|nr:hypothetical protein [Ignavibacteriota bacterium]